MAETQIRTAFDLKERERVRAALLRYMQEHRIGTPALKGRIEDADKPRRREIPLSTLQRFLSKTHHTHDHHIALCHAFVKDLPYYSERYDITQFGEALAMFLQGSENRAGWHLGKSPLVGEFNTAIHRLALPKKPRLAHPDEGMFPDEIDYSHMIFEQVPGGDRSLFVAEHVYNPNVVTSRKYDDQPLYRYEGLAVLTSEDTAIVVQRDTLTRQPRTCYLTRAINHSHNIATLFYMQAIWVPFRSGSLPNDGAAETVTLHVTSAADDDRRGKEFDDVLGVGTGDPE